VLTEALVTRILDQALAELVVEGSTTSTGSGFLRHAHGLGDVTVRRR
jgi:hypothetical protein